jgi:hypothetical protein
MIIETSLRANTPKSNQPNPYLIFADLKTSYAVIICVKRFWRQFFILSFAGFLQPFEGGN